MSNTVAMRLFDENEFRRSSRVDKIYIDIINPGKYSLTSSETLYKYVLNRAFVVVSEMINHQKAINFIMELEGCSRFEANTIMKDAESLYGRFRSVNKDVLRVQIIDVLTREMEKAVQLGKQDMIVRIAAEIGRVGRLSEKEMDVWDPSSLEIPAPTYTSDPSALIEDVTYEEEE